MNPEVQITPAAFPYLIAQRGVLDRFKNNVPRWIEEYQAMLRGEFNLIEPYLPKAAQAILDVGSGMGGIDILLSRHYGTRPALFLLDGIDDEPVVSLHRSTFNRVATAIGFLNANETYDCNFINAAEPAPIGPIADLVISTAAWCFHFEPGLYIDYVAASCAPGATLILDVRKNQQAWLDELGERFIHIDCILRSFKFETHVFRTPHTFPQPPNSNRKIPK